MILEIKNLHKSFADLEVLKGISLSVDKGDVVSVIGPSGSGKSTLLRCATFLETMDSGEIRYLDRAAAWTGEEGKAVYLPQSELRRMKSVFGLVFQQFNLFPHYTVLHNLMASPMVVQKRSREEAEQTARELLKRMGLEDKAESYPCQLSGGQQQRVSIARAIVKNPKLILADEPTAALDLSTSIEVLNVIEDIVEEKGTTVMMVTHNPEIGKMADRVIKLRSGKIASIKRNIHPLHAKELSW